MARNLHDVTCRVKKSKSSILKRVGSDQHIFIKLFRANAAGCVGSKPTFGHPVDLKKMLARNKLALRAFLGPVRADASGCVGSKTHSRHRTFRAYKPIYLVVFCLGRRCCHMSKNVKKLLRNNVQVNHIKRKQNYAASKILKEKCSRRG